MIKRFTVVTENKGHIVTARFTEDINKRTNVPIGITVKDVYQTDVKYNNVNIVTHRVLLIPVEHSLVPPKCGDLLGCNDEGQLVTWNPTNNVYDILWVVGRCSAIEDVTAGSSVTPYNPTFCNDYRDYTGKLMLAHINLV